MINKRQLIALTFAALTVAVPASAQTVPRVEVGAALVDFTIVWAGQGSKAVLLGVPSTAVGLVNPSAYAAFFVNRRVTVEPRLSVLFISSGEYNPHRGPGRTGELPRSWLREFLSIRLRFCWCGDGVECRQHTEAIERRRWLQSARTRTARRAS